jgi:hypothetical protein
MVTGDYSPPEDKIPTGAFADNAVCDRVFLDSNLSRLRANNKSACKLDQTNNFFYKRSSPEQFG